RVDVAQWRRLCRDHVDVDAKTAGMQSDWLLNALGSVDRVERRMRVEDNLAVLVDRILAGLEQLVDVGLLNRMAAEFDLDIGNVADKATSSVAGPYILDGEARHTLGKLHRLTHGELARGHVSDESAFHSAALALAGTEDGQPPLTVLARDHRADF